MFYYKQIKAFINYIILYIYFIYIYYILYIYFFRAKERKANKIKKLASQYFSSLLEIAQYHGGSYLIKHKIRKWMGS